MKKIFLFFSYHFLPGPNVITFDDTPLGRGAAGYLVKNVCLSLRLFIINRSYWELIAFSFESIAIHVNTFFDVKEADYVMGASVGLSNRLKVVDFPASYYHTGFWSVVPYPKENVNLSSTYKPLSYQVSSSEI